MRILSALGVIFLPLSTVGTIFGTQFFTSVQSDDLQTGYMHINPQFWVLWAIALPLTLGILLFWLAWEKMGRNGHFRARRLREQKSGFALPQTRRHQNA